jgi:hypothetical protein
VIWFFEEVPCWQFELAASMGKQSKRPVVMRNRVEVKKTARHKNERFRHDAYLLAVEKVRRAVEVGGPPLLFEHPKLEYRYPEPIDVASYGRDPKGQQKLSDRRRLEQAVAAAFNDPKDVLEKRRLCYIESLSVVLAPENVDPETGMLRQFYVARALKRVRTDAWFVAEWQLLLSRKL